MPPVPTNAIFSGTASHALLNASPNAHDLCKGVSGGPWQFILTGMTGISYLGVRKFNGTIIPWSNFHSSE